MLRYWLVALVGWILVGGVAAGQGGYGYPFSDPLVATVLGTPPSHRAELDYDVPRVEREIVVFPGRKVARVVPRHAYRYGIAKQDHSAPLIFVIAGTGGSHRTANMRLLEAAFFDAGFHVVTLSSPTHANFIITASETHIPGRSTDDAVDMHRVMEMVWAEHKDSLDVTGFHITGFSLGGANAAFVAAYDREQRPVFNFEKVLLINPPVNLYSSIKKLDSYLDSNIPGPVAPDFDTFFDRMVRRLTEVYVHNDQINFDSEFLYQVSKASMSDGVELSSKELEVLIGAAFRLALANMLTTADYAAQRGFIIPKNHRFSITESTTDYFKVATRSSFVDYFEQLFLPYFEGRLPHATRESLIRETSLAGIEDFLKTADYVAVVHNADDIILADGELDYLRGIFGSRATIYPVGGHLGNLSYRDNVAFMVDYFKQ